MNLAENRTQPGFGALIIFLYALYGIYVTSLFMLMGDKLGIRSADFFIFVIVILLFYLSNFGNLLITAIFEIGQKSIILVLILYMLLRLLMEDSDIQLYYLGTIFPQIVKNFIAGFIAYSLLKSNVPIVSTIIELPTSTKGIKRLTIVCTVMFFVMIFYFLIKFQGISLFNIVKIVYFSNEYYQTFGDYFVLAYCCLVTLQLLYYMRNNNSDRGFYIFSPLLAVEGIMAFICLQMVTSNKAVLVTTLVSAIAIYFVAMKSFLKNYGIIKSIVFYIIPTLIVVWLLVTIMISIFDTSSMRIYDFGESESMVRNNSIESRWDHFIDTGIDQILRAPMFGDFSIVRGKVVHSSLISVQTQLGILGSFLLWSYIIKRLMQLYKRSGNEGLKSIALPIVLVSIISSDFVWGPLWFIIGALYEYDHQSIETIDPLA